MSGIKDHASLYFMLALKFSVLVMVPNAKPTSTYMYKVGKAKSTQMKQLVYYYYCMHTYIMIYHVIYYCHSYTFEYILIFNLKFSNVNSLTCFFF